jgi:cation-transporting ATPase E
VPEEGSLLSRCVRPLALLILRNPVRPQAVEAFRYFAQQGVSIKVISGDHPATASRVAQQAGIENSDKWVDASALETPEDYLKAVRDNTVFGRVTPDQKKKLIQALKKLGHTVAMTGDGVNDVLALREADCSVAMAGGAQAASQVARLVLVDDDFSTMPGIVAEGRRVVNNIQRAAALFLVKNIFSLGLSLISVLSGLAYPLVPIQLTLISALTIGVPSFFLAMEPNYQRFHGNFLAGVLRRALPGGLTNILAVLGVQLCAGLLNLSSAQTGTVCAGILGVVGLLVLYAVSKPVQKFRAVVWVTMAAALLVSFTLLGGFFELHTGIWLANPVSVIPLLLTPLLFFGVTCLLELWKGRQHADL